MNIEEFRDFCLSLPAVEETTPFDETTLVYKVCGKMFTLCATDDFSTGVALKCDPDYAVELREKYPDDIFPGYHMNKRHWNTVLTEGNLPVEFTRQLILDSYRLVVEKLPKKEREALLK